MGRLFRVCVFLLVVDSSVVARSMFLSVLDSVQTAMTGQAVYDRQQFQSIVSALTRFDPQLYHSQENGWRGLIAYYQEGGGLADQWGETPSNLTERNATFLQLPHYQKLLVLEPCNFASNIAYYHMNIALASYDRWALSPPTVRGLAQASAGLALGSAFWHGSNTELGGEADTVMIAVMAYIMQQASMEHLTPTIKTSVLSDLKMERRVMSGVEIAQLLTDMYRTEPNSNWLNILTTLDIPSYETSFSALITSLLTLLFPAAIVQPAAAALIDLFGIDTPTKHFILQAYIPEVRRAFSGIEITPGQRIDLLFSTITTVKKLVYAFLFQEITFNIQFLVSPLGTQLGAWFQPVLNAKAGLPSTLPQLSQRLSSGQGLYPGDTWCRSSQPHSLWHAQSAAGLIDFFLLVDKVVKIVYH